MYAKNCLWKCRFNQRIFSAIISSIFFCIRALGITLGAQKRPGIYYEPHLALDVRPYGGSLGVDCQSQ